jgi:hypothetical protein
MLFRQTILDGLRRGTVTVAFRRWHRPSVRAGGTLLTPVGQLSIASVSPVALLQISEADALRAGYESLSSLLAELRKVADGAFYRIEFGALQPDPRRALRESLPREDEERDAVAERLRRLDARSHEGPWTLRTLEVIRSHPGVRAGTLSGLLGQEKEAFKLNVRKLKGLGLTESLEIGYRLSPRGAHFLRSVLRGE